MLFFSHWLDLIGKLASVALIFALLAATGGLKTAESVMEQTANPELFMLLFLIAAMTGYYFAFHRPVVDVLVTQGYVRLRFGVAVSWEEARLLRCLFCLNLRTFQWHPMKHVCSMPQEQRLTALVDAARA